MELFKEIKEIIISLFAIAEDEVTEEAHLQVDLGLDSLGLLNLATAINEKHGLELLIDDLMELENISELVSLVDSKLIS